MHAPFTTWILAAHSAPELASWMGGFATLLGEANIRTAGSPTSVTAAPSHGYVPIGDGEPTGGRATHTPVPMLTEEVM